jgi:hypothetical protein
MTYEEVTIIRADSKQHNYSLSATVLTSLSRNASYAFICVIIDTHYLMRRDYWKYSDRSATFG